MIEGWTEYPPLGILVKAIVVGFGGRPAAKSQQPQAAADDSVLTELSVKAGRALPVIRGKDSGLPQAKPMFDFEALKQKNAERRVKAIRIKDAGH